MREIAKGSYYRLGAPAWRRRLVAALPLIGTKLGAHVVSHGGVATTALCEAIAQQVHTNDPYDRDRLKHVPSPNPAVALRRVYVVGDPLLAVVSLFRRDYAKLQARKNGFFGRNFPDSVDEYAQRGRDDLGLERHLTRWSHPPNLGSTLIMDYEALWSHIDVIEEYLCLDAGSLRLVPRRQRASDKLEVAPLVKHRLKAIYGQYERKRAQLAPFRVVSR